MSYYQISRHTSQDKDADLLLGQFLVKLELLRLTELQGSLVGQSPSRAEFLLMKENEMLKAKLGTYKDNIVVLQKLVDQIRGGAHARSVRPAHRSAARSPRPNCSAQKKTRISRGCPKRSSPCTDRTKASANRTTV